MDEVVKLDLRFARSLAPSWIWSSVRRAGWTSGVPLLLCLSRLSIPSLPCLLLMVRVYLNFCIQLSVDGGLGNGEGGRVWRGACLA